MEEEKKKPRSSRTITVKDEPKRTRTSKPKDKEKKGLSKEELAKKVQESKSLSDVIKTLSDKNSPKSEKETTKLAKDTIKLVAEAQKSGSLAFKRESTKALVQIRSAVEKMAFANEADKDQLISDLDTVALDAKNVMLYMKSVAKAQADLYREKEMAEIKLIKLRTTNESRLMKTEAKAEAKKIKAQSLLESDALKERTEEDLKQRKAEQVLRIKALRLSLKDREKELEENSKLRDIRAKAEQEEALQKVKTYRADSLVQVKTIKERLAERRKKADADFAERKLELKRDKEKHVLEMRTMRDTARARIKQIYSDMETEKKLRKERDRKMRSSRFLQMVGDGVEDALPLLSLATKLVTGARDIGIRPKTKEGSEEGSLKKLEKIFSGDQKKDEREDLTKLPKLDKDKGKSGTIAPKAAEEKKGGLFSSILSLFPSFSSFVTGIGSLLTTAVSFGKRLAPIIAKGIRVVPIIGTVASGIMAVFDFVDGFNNASKLFGGEEKITLTKKLFSGFVNVFGSILGLVDTVAGWIGFDIDLKKKFETGAVSVYKTAESIIDSIIDGAKVIFNSILAPYKFLSEKLANILVKIPGFDENSDAVKTLRDFGKGSKGVFDIVNTKPSTVGMIQQKSTQIKELEEKAEEAKNKKAGSTTAVIDNSVKNTNTTIMNQRLSTRNDDPSIKMYGYALNH